MKKLVLTLLFCFPIIIFAKDKPQSINQKINQCTPCHGQDGNSSNMDWPIIAGQHTGYFVKQLKDMKEGTARISPIMNTMLASLSEQDMDDLAEYYAKMPVPKNGKPQIVNLRGEQLYKGGDSNKKITACIACHGPRGTGNGQAGFPVISGQHARYTILQLIAFQRGQRTNDLNHIMQNICANMNQEDMESVANYIEQLY